MPSPALDVRLLGQWQIQYGETPLSGVLTPRLRSLVSYLILHQDKVPSRQQLAFLFWPDSSEGQARTNLRKAFHRLRQIFPAPESFLDLDGDVLAWRQDAPLRLDVADFETRLREAETAPLQEQPALLEAAMAIYGGDLLPDLYDDWVLPVREQLRQRYLDALDLLAELQEAKRDYAAASQTTRRLLREDALREHSYRRLMRLQALNGDVAGALHTYHRCVALLEQELGVEPAPATQAAYRRLLKQQSLPQPASPALVTRGLPLIGRDREWQTLLAAWQVVVKGNSQAVFISGEAGIGKTRLAEELLAWAGRQGIPTLRATCFSGGDELPFAPIADWLRAELVQQALPALPTRWRSEVARVLPELLATIPELEMPRPMTEAWQKQHFFMALAEAVGAAGAPLVLFLDDLHWADANTLAWLQFLMRQKRDTGFLFLAATRSEEMMPDHPVLAWQHELERSVAVQHIALSRLDATTTTALAEHLLGEELAGPVAGALFEATEGNPLFTVEMARAGLQTAELPHKARSVIAGRLNQLTPKARELTELAALVGRRFSFSLLAAASALPRDDVVRNLDELWRRQIVREETVGAGQEAYDFSHDRIREVALAQVSSARRRWGHRRVAEAFEQAHSGNLDAFHGQIAAHWEAAGHPREAADHYVQAAQAASHVYAHEESVRHLQRALALLPSGHPRRAEINGQLGEALIVLSRNEDAAAAFAQASAETDSVPERTRLISRRVIALTANKHFQEARLAYHEGMMLLEAIPAPVRDTATWRIWLDLQFSVLDAIYFENKPDDMSAIFEAMASVLDAYGSARQRSQYSRYLALTGIRSNRVRPAVNTVALAEEALKWAEQTGDEAIIASQRFLLGFAYLWAERAADAIGPLQRALATDEALGNLPMQSRTLTYLGIAYRLHGDEAGVRRLVNQGTPVVQADANPYYVGVVEAQEAWLAWRAGDLRAVEKHGRAAIVLWEPFIPSTFLIQWVARLPLLAMAVETGQVAAALEQAETLLHPYLQRLPDPLTEALSAAVAAEPPSAAMPNLREACRLAHELGYL